MTSSDACGARLAARAGRARAAGPADAGGPARDVVDDEFRRAVLNLRRIAVVAPDPGVFPNFEESLRQAFQQETTLFVDSIIREDRGALDLLTPAIHSPTSGSRNTTASRTWAGRSSDAWRCRPTARIAACWTGQHSDGDLARDADVSGQTRQVDPGTAAGSPRRRRRRTFRN